MRSPERIDEIVEALPEVWKQNPNLRLGQLIVNGTKPKEPQLEIFNVEDDALLAGLKNYQQTVRQRFGNR